MNMRSITSILAISTALCAASAQAQVAAVSEAQADEPTNVDNGGEPGKAEEIVVTGGLSPAFSSRFE